VEFKRYHSGKQFSEFCLQDGDKEQLAQIWNDYYATVTLCIFLPNILKIG